MGEQYCDNCGYELIGKRFVPVSELQEDITSANAGESAVLCLNCAARLGEYKAIRYLRQPPRAPGWQEVLQGHQFDAEQRAKEANEEGDEAAIVMKYLVSGYRGGEEPVYFVYTRPLSGGEWEQDQVTRRHAIYRRPEVHVRGHQRRSN